MAAALVATLAPLAPEAVQLVERFIAAHKALKAASAANPSVPTPAQVTAILEADDAAIQAIDDEIEANADAQLNPPAA